MRCVYTQDAVGVIKPTNENLFFQEESEDSDFPALRD